MPFSVVLRDITTMQVDAIVNAANTALRMGGGVCGAIFKAAGATALTAACAALAPIETGEAVVTPGFGLPARRIIHTAGPVYRGGAQGEEAQLRACWLNSLARAEENGCASVAFPLISSGIYGYPKAEALRVAVTAVRDFLGDRAHGDLDIYLAVFDAEALAAGEALIGELFDRA
jgi:O-acetyl-ADP-ribose deacetylase (regulator of RNase III)